MGSDSTTKSKSSSAKGSTSVSFDAVGGLTSDSVANPNNSNGHQSANRRLDVDGGSSTSDTITNSLIFDLKDNQNKDLDVKFSSNFRTRSLSNAFVSLTKPVSTRWMKIFLVIQCWILIMVVCYYVGTIQDRKTKTKSKVTISGPIRLTLSACQDQI